MSAAMVPLPAAVPRLSRAWARSSSMTVRRWGRPARVAATVAAVTHRRQVHQVLPPADGARRRRVRPARTGNRPPPARRRRSPGPASARPGGRPRRGAARRRGPGRNASSSTRRGSFQELPVMRRRALRRQLRGVAGAAPRAARPRARPAAGPRRGPRRRSGPSAARRPARGSQALRVETVGRRSGWCRSRRRKAGWSRAHRWNGRLCTGPVQDELAAARAAPGRCRASRSSAQTISLASIGS